MQNGKIQNLRLTWEKRTEISPIENLGMSRELLSTGQMFAMHFDPEQLLNCTMRFTMRKKTPL